MFAPVTVTHFVDCPGHASIGPSRLKHFSWFNSCFIDESGPPILTDLHSSRYGIISMPIYVLAFNHVSVSTGLAICTCPVSDTIALRPHLCIGCDLSVTIRPCATTNYQWDCSTRSRLRVDQAGVPWHSVPEKKWFNGRVSVLGLAKLAPKKRIGTISGTKKQQNSHQMTN